MEPRRLDNLSRMMANGASRRALLRCVLGGAVAAVGLRAEVSARPNKVDICHLTGNGSYRHISVSENTLDAHLAHGDRIPPDECGRNLELDYSTCECACPITECGVGFTFDPDRCMCWCGGEFGELGVPCADQGICHRSTEGETVCVGAPSEACDEGVCVSSNDCANDGWQCAFDTTCGAFRCHPPV